LQVTAWESKAQLSYYFVFTFKVNKASLYFWCFSICYIYEKLIIINEIYSFSLDKKVINAKHINTLERQQQLYFLYTQALNISESWRFIYPFPQTKLECEMPRLIIYSKSSRFEWMALGFQEKSGFWQKEKGKINWVAIQNLKFEPTYLGSCPLQSIIFELQQLKFNKLIRSA